MPKWTPEVDAKLLAAIVLTSDTFNLTSIANLMSVEGDECTVKALNHRIARLKVVANETWPDEVAAAAMAASPPKTTRKRKAKVTTDDGATSAVTGSAGKKAKTTAKKEDANIEEDAGADAVEDSPTKKGKGVGKGRGGRGKKKVDTAVAEQIVKTEEGVAANGETDGVNTGTEAEVEDEKPTGDDAVAAGA